MMKLRTLIAVLVPLFPAVSHGAVRTVALANASAPGTPAGANFFTFNTPTISPGGHVGFEATLALGSGGVVSTNDSGVWAEGVGPLALIARKGSQAPGTASGANFNDVRDPVVSSTGQAAFLSTMSGPAAGVTLDNNEGIWSQSGGTLGLVAREANNPPGTSAGVQFGTILNPSLNSAGQLAFRAFLKGTGVTTANDSGVWNYESGVLNLVARAGEQVPGAPAGVNFSGFSTAIPAYNAAGQTALRGFLTGSGVTASNDSGIWVERGGAVVLVAREGSQAPGLPAGVNFDAVADPVLNRHGDTAFVGNVLGTGVTGTNNDALWAEIGGGLSLLARGGSPAPGTAAGVNFATFASPMLNGEGQAGFFGTLIGTGVTTANFQGIWLQRTSGLELMVRQGTQAAGLAAGVNLGPLANPVLSSAGQIAFTSTLTGGGVTTTNDVALFALTLGGAQKLIAREGDPIEVSPGVMRTISTLTFGGMGFSSVTEDGRRAGLSNRGDVVFSATFTDGTSGVFVSDAVKAASGDFNGDGSVDGADFLVLQRGLGRVGSGQPSNGDADFDGDVDAADFVIFKTKFGAPAAVASAAAVPEPGALALLAIAASAAMARRRCAISAASPFPPS